MHLLDLLLYWLHGAHPMVVAATLGIALFMVTHCMEARLQ